MNPEHKKYILENIGKKSVKQIAGDLRLKEKVICRVLEKEKKAGQKEIVIMMTHEHADKKSFKEISSANEHVHRDAFKSSYFNNRTVYNLILVFVFIIGIFLRITFLGTAKHSSRGDENFYVEYARYMAQDAGASVKSLIRNYIDKKEWHVYPTPIRTGHIILSSIWMRTMNRFDNVALLYMSCFFSVLSLFLSYVFAKKLFGEKIAFLSLILFTVSPLGLALSKRVLQEPDAYFFIILTLYFFYQLLKSENILFKAIFMVSFFISVMIKETSVMLAGFFFLCIFAEKIFFNNKLKILPVTLSVIFPLIAVFFSYVSLTGGFYRLIDLLKIILLTPMTNPYVIEFQSGSFFRYLHDFFLLSPITLILALVFLFLYLTGKQFKGESCGYLVIFSVFFYAIFSLFNKNVRAVFPLDFPIRVFSVLVIYDLFTTLNKKRDGVVAALIIVIAIIDLAIFKHMFVTCDVYDPVTYNLQLAWRTWLKI